MQNPKKNDNFAESFKYAWAGIKTAYVEERNFRKHLATTVLVFILGLIFSFSISEFLWLSVACFAVIISELVNTLVENIVNLITLDYHPLAKKIKDVAAGTVLITSFFAVIIGLFLFLPKFLSLF